MKDSTVVEENIDGVATFSGDKIDECGKIISNSMKWSVAASVIPVPTLDLIAIGATQANMIAEISKVYGSSIPKEVVRTTISVLLGVLAPVGASAIVVNGAMKFLPGYGTLISGVSMATFAAASTYAIGKIFVAHYEGGGTFADFKPEVIAEKLKAEFNAAKNTVKA